MAMAMTAMTSWFKNVWQYVIIGVAALVAIFAIYRKGKVDERVEARAEVAEAEVANVREAQEVRRDVAAAGDDELDVRVRRWTVERH